MLRTCHLGRKHPPEHLNSLFKKSKKKGLSIAGTADEEDESSSQLAQALNRDQERTQLYMGHKPGQFDVEYPEGQENQVVSTGEKDVEQPVNSPQVAPKPHI